MILETLSAILGITVILGGFAIWVINVFIKVHDSLARIKNLEEQNTKIIRKVDSFQDEFQNFFLKQEQIDKAFFKTIDKRLDRLERGISVYIAKNGGTIPPLGED